MSNYKGFSNRETWAVHLYLSNDEDFHEMLKSEIKWNNRNPDTIASFLEDVLFSWEYWFDKGLMSKELLKMFFDIGDINQVDWDEVAQNFIEGEE
jgi:hypothetical protein